MKVIQVYDKLDRRGGAQTVLFNLYRSFTKKGVNSLISSPVPYSCLVDREKVVTANYFQIRVRTFRRLKGGIVISHSRKTTTILCVLKKLFRCNFEIIHVAHSVFYSKKNSTIFSGQVVAVSYAVKRNLVDYFRVPIENIRVIYSGLDDIVGEISLPRYQPKVEIRILYAGRIEPVKRQVEIVHQLSNKLKSNIKIDFAGEGSDSNFLQAAIEKTDCDNFTYLGYQEGIPKLAVDYHYVLLFSEKEGLGLSLVEGCMAGRPLISRSEDGCEACSEVCIDGYNGFIVNNYEKLLLQLNSLDEIPCEEYAQLCTNSRKLFEEKFLISTMVENYFSEVQSIEPKLR
jgi:glycosyltransferase involved in cell wall biosynthesis